MLEMTRKNPISTLQVLLEEMDLQSLSALAYFRCNLVPVTLFTALKVSVPVSLVVRYLMPLMHKQTFLASQFRVYKSGMSLSDTAVWRCAWWKGRSQVSVNWPSSTPPVTDLI